VSLDALARAVADAAAYLSRMPVTPAPLERTDRAPWVWVTAQARRAQVDPRALAAALRRDDRIDAVATRPDGLLEVTVTPNFVAAALRDLASGSGMPSAPLPLVPAGPEGDAFRLAVSRFEAARIAGGAAPLPAQIAARRTLDNPVMVVLLAHARAARVAEQVLGSGPSSVDPSALRTLTDPLDLALLAEVLDAPRRLAWHETRPQEVAAGLLAVATAYLAWEEHCPGLPTRPGEVTTARHLARQLVSRAGRSVLERGMAVLGVSAPARM
jgi:hypothetical protein